MLQQSLQLCLVTAAQAQSFSQYQAFLLKALAGGVTLVQLREKSKSPRELYAWARALKSLLKPFNVPLIINDHLDLACEIDADGVHLGQGDISPLEARAKLGANKIIGWSIESLAELEIANQTQGLDYLAASAVFPSRSKPECKTIWGLKGLNDLSKRSRYPVMAIGGIGLENITEVIEQGACGVAVISALHEATNPNLTAAQLLAAIQRKN